MTEVTDRGAVPIHGIEFAMVLPCQDGNIVKQSFGIDGRFGLEIPEDHERFGAIAGMRYQFPQGVPEVTIKLAAPISHHQDNVGMHPLDHMRPTDASMSEYRIVEVFDDATARGESVLECGFYPLPCQLSGMNGGINANHMNFDSC